MDLQAKGSGVAWNLINVGLMANYSSNVLESITFYPPPLVIKLSSTSSKKAAKRSFVGSKKRERMFPPIPLSS